MLKLDNLPKPANKSSPTASIRGILSGLNESQTFEQGQYFTEPGEYIAEVVECLHKKSNTSGAWVYIMKFKILENISPETSTGPKSGSTRSVAQKLSDTNVAFPVLKQFALACLNPSTPEERAEAETECEAALEAAADPEKQLFKGVKIRVVVTPKVTKKTQTLIHVASFYGVDNG